jgi:predicted O-methyltransferase YrrM
MSKSKLDELLANIPKLHFWNNNWYAGGLWPDALKLMLKHAFGGPAAETVILETGAGLSTLAYLAMDPKEVISVCPDKKLFERIEREAISREISLTPHTKHIEFSEIALPGIVLGKAPFVDFAFIDGGHNFTSVWVDFVYANFALKEGGVIAVDDVQLHSCRQLALYLKASPDWENIANNFKTYYYKKKSDRRLEGDFNVQEFVTINSL